MDTGLRGKTALITGGGSGIGRGIALALAREGVHIAIASRAPDPDAVAEVLACGVRCGRIEADVSREDAVVRMVDEAVTFLGHLDFYVNNAAWTWHEPITRLSTEAWRSTLDTNLSAAMWSTREAAKHMISRRRGAIVLVGSTVRFFPAFGETAYRVSKSGLKALAEQSAIELAPHGIRVNMVTPGHYRTRMTSGVSEVMETRLRELIPMQRFGCPTEVGNAVAFLLSEKLSGYTTGADLVIDGGLSMNPLPLRTPEEVANLNL